MRKCRHTPKIIYHDFYVHGVMMFQVVVKICKRCKKKLK